MNEKYFDNLHRKYGAKKVEHQTPYAVRMTKLKYDIVKKGLPYALHEGVVSINERGDLIFTLNDGQVTYFVNCNDSELTELKMEENGRQ